MIVGIIFITITAPIWICITVFYLFVMGFFYLALIVIFIIKILYDGYNFYEAMGLIVFKIIESFYKWFVRVDDIFDYFWEFGRYEHQGWAIAISIYIFLIYARRNGLFHKKF